MRDCLALMPNNPQHKMKYTTHSKLKELLFSRVFKSNNVENIANRHRFIENERNYSSKTAIHAKQYITRNYVKK
jgi:hypothetical protein